jgi:Family of unknown function (DUF6496)
MPYTEVMHKFKHGGLHSGSSSGPVVHNRKQAIAIMLSEKRRGTHEDTNSHVREELRSRAKHKSAARNAY